MVLIFYEMEAVILIFRWTATPSHTPLSGAPPHTKQIFIIYSESWYAISELGKQKQKWIERPISNRYEKEKLEKPSTAWSTYYPKKLVCKFWYDSANKCATHKHLGANTPKNVIFSKSTIELWNRKKIRITDCSMKNQPCKQTCMHNLISIRQ